MSPRFRLVEMLVSSTGAVSCRQTIGRYETREAADRACESERSTYQRNAGMSSHRCHFAVEAAQ